jgi:hypothetical protein
MNWNKNRKTPTYRDLLAEIRAGQVHGVFINDTGTPGRAESPVLRRLPSGRSNQLDCGSNVK